MAGGSHNSHPRWYFRMPPLARFAPGLAKLLEYKLADAPADIRAGLAVTAVAVPVGIAYAGLAGFRPEVGLYSSLLPLVAYAIFGSSRQLIVGPDAATCAVIAAAVAPLAGGDEATYASLSAMLALLTGLICIAASFLRLGALADFLSRPILVGFLNGVALSIILGQADKIFGFAVLESGILPRLVEILGKLGESHGPTLAVAAGTFLAMAIAPRLLPWLPAALVGMTLAGAAVFLFHLTDFGVKTVGPVPGGLPALTLPQRQSRASSPAAGGSGGLSTCQLLKSDAYRSKFCDEKRIRHPTRPGFRGVGRGKCGVRRVARVRHKRGGLTHSHERCGRGKNACRWARGGRCGGARAAVFHRTVAIRPDGGTRRRARRRGFVLDRYSQRQPFLSN